MFLAVTVLLTINGTCAAAGEKTNVALKKPCKMSTQGPARSRLYPCEKGNDGNTDQNLFHGSCFHSDAADKNFWRVDLGAEYEITHIRIFNRLDAGVRQARNIFVYIGYDGNERNKKRVAKFRQLPDIANIHVDPGVKGNFVKVIQNSPPGEQLMFHLCEIQVFSPKV